jgi:hypothetical protein
MRFDVLTLCSLALAVAADFGLAAWVFVQTRGWSKIIAPLPAAVVVAWGVNLVVDLRADPTDHNLWPLELLLIAIMGCLFSIGLLALLRLLAPRQMQQR